MTLRLVKTDKGFYGAPTECSCGCKSFIPSGGGFTCLKCMKYCPPVLKDQTNSTHLVELKLRLAKLDALRAQLNAMINQLEEVVK